MSMVNARYSDDQEAPLERRPAEIGSDAKQIALRSFREQQMRGTHRKAPRPSAKAPGRRRPRPLTTAVPARRKKVNVTGQGLRDLDKARGLLYGLREEAYQEKVARTAPARQELAEVKRKRRVRRLEGKALSNRDADDLDGACPSCEGSGTCADCSGSGLMGTVGVGGQPA
jgi:hypothetical protein